MKWIWETFIDATSAFTESMTDYIEPVVSLWLIVMALANVYLAFMR